MSCCRHSWFFILLLAVIQSGVSAAQQPNNSCAMPAFATTSNEPNMFNEQQEEWLGEISAQRIQREFNVIPDPESNYLQKLGERLLAHLPPGKTHYRFTIIDSPVNDAFGAAGGYIYLSRRLIALAQTEDELAGVLGHEIGHIVTHQTAIEFTRDFNAVLGVTQVGDRKDIFEKWNQLIDAAQKRNYKFDEKREQREQLVADRIALYAMARAGYRPYSFVDFFDRLAQTKGNKGSFWTDFFHTTNPDSKRLRELIRNATPLPPECVSAPVADANTHFLKWQKAVIGSNFAAAKEEIPGLLSKILLKPKLRGDLDSIQFSADGNYLLAQDGSSIFVLSREPLANLFRIESPDSYPAQFTPDSRSIVFYDKELRVQKWEITTQQRSSIYELSLSSLCIQSGLSPTGEVLACLTPEFELQLIEVSSNNILYSRKKFYEPLGWELFFQAVLDVLGGEPLQFMTLRFSPDGHYFLAGHSKNAVAFDLLARREIPLPKKVKEIMYLSFTFTGPDEIAGYEQFRFVRNIVRMRFPGGERLDELPVSTIGELGAPVKGKYLLLLHSGAYPVAALDLEARKVVTASKVAGFAIYDRIYAGEMQGGDVALMNMSDNKILSKLQLPDSPLEISRIADFSSDGKWLAVSGPTRGAVWKLETGDRVFHTWGFLGAVFDQDQLIAQFPQKDKNPARVVKLDTTTTSTKDLYQLEGGGSTIVFTGFSFSTFTARSRQFGDLLVTIARDPSRKGFNFNFSVRDVRTNKELWTHEMAREIPRLFYEKAGRTLTLVIGDYENIKAEAKSDPALNARLNAIEGKEGKKDSYVVRAFDALTGKDLGAVLVDTGNLSFKIRWAITIGDTVLVSDSHDRTLVYSLKSGEQKGKVLGLSQAVSKDGRRMLVDNGKGAADVYDTSTMQPVAHFSFPSRIVHAEFLENSDSIFILTADQTVYTLKNPTEQAAEVH